MNREELETRYEEESVSVPIDFLIRTMKVLELAEVCLSESSYKDSSIREMILDYANGLQETANISNEEMEELEEMEIIEM